MQTNLLTCSVLGSKYGCLSHSCWSGFFPFVVTNFRISTSRIKFQRTIPCSTLTKKTNQITRKTQTLTLGKINTRGKSNMFWSRFFHGHCVKSHRHSTSRNTVNTHNWSTPNAVSPATNQTPEREAERTPWIQSTTPQTPICSTPHHNQQRRSIATSWAGEGEAMQCNVGQYLRSSWMIAYGILCATFRLFLYERKEQVRLQTKVRKRGEGGVGSWSTRKIIWKERK